MGFLASVGARLNSPRLLAAAFTTSGILHFVVPGKFESIVPRFLPQRRALVYASGAAELVCAAGLFAETTWAGPASATLLAAVWPANLQMAIDEQRSSQSPARKAAMWLRLPMQIPMIRTALRAGRP